jgi:nucleoside ABC transporter ATP-binding protein
VKNDRNLEAVNDLSLDIRSGEILGMAGVSGNGQRELAEALFGLRKPVSGTISVDGGTLPRAGRKPR